MKLDFSRHIFGKYSKSNFIKIRPAWDELFDPKKRQSDRHDKA